MIIVGINAYHPDAAVALLKNGEVIWAAEEERFNRIKHSAGFPALALQHCLKETNLDPQSIDVVAISKNPRANFIKKTVFTLLNRPSLALVGNRLSAMKKANQFKKDYAAALSLDLGTLKTRFVHVEHHRAHAASAFYFSGFEKAAFLSLDGLGDFSSAMWGYGEGNQLHAMDRVFFPHSIGFFYTAGTQFLGFHKFGDEYKVMGLAAYGKPVFLEAMRKIVRLCPDGKFELNLKYFMHPKGQAKIKWEGGYPEQDMLFSSEWEKEFGRPKSFGETLTERDRDLAASMQKIVEEVYFHILNHLHKKTGLDCLAMAGGVAYNSVANGKITQNTPFKNVFIQPAAGDAGTAIGAAAAVYYQDHPRLKTPAMNHALLGTSVSDDDALKIIKKSGLQFEKLTETDLLEKTASAIAQGKIVGWCQGKMEFGPRALGNRSILADPRNPNMKDILNKRVKNRENFRPFAPAVIVERAKDFFEMDFEDSPFMLKVVPVKPDKQKLLPAITHVDGSARVQTVDKESNPLFWKLISKFGEMTGVPILLNTSFNEHEPIVCTAEEAVNCFMKTQMDVLVVGHYLITKEASRCIP